MRIFVTGASGWIGTAVVNELLSTNHQVVGLARSAVSAQKLESAGATAFHGNLQEPDALARAANECDGVIHLAFQHDLAWSGNFAAAAATDRRVVEALGAVLAGSDRPFVHASGLLGMMNDRLATETDGLVPSASSRANPSSARAATALLVLSLRGLGVRSSVIRYPPTVHGNGDAGFLAAIVATARQHGAASYVGDGQNRWPAVHRSDAARLTRLAVESAPAGSVLHAVAEQGVKFIDIARAVSHGLDLPTASITPSEAVAQYSFLGPSVALDSPASSEVTRDLLHWSPHGPGLLADLAERHYYSS